LSNVAKIRAFMVLYDLTVACTILLYNHIRGRVSKQVTNGSKTAVMGVIGFLCVSLGSSTVQLHDSLGEVRFSSRNGDRA
jgi:hypothetical protein